jgi:hypothetical protein
MKKDDAKKATKEEREAALQKKITEEIKARKEISDEAIAKQREEYVKSKAEDEIRFRKLHEERKGAIAAIEAETAQINAKEAAAGRLSS